MDHQHLKEIALDRNRKLYTAFWAIFFAVVILIVYGREAIMLEAMKAAGYIGAAIMGLIIGLFVRKNS